MGSRVRIRLLHILHVVMDFLFPLLKNSKSGVDDRGHRLRITHTLHGLWCYHSNEFVKEYSRFSDVIIRYVSLQRNYKSFQK